jgi:hypothetical protein
MPKNELPFEGRSRLYMKMVKKLIEESNWTRINRINTALNKIIKRVDEEFPETHSFPEIHSVYTFIHLLN